MKRKILNLVMYVIFCLQKTQNKKERKGIREYVLFLGNAEKIKGFFTLGFRPPELELLFSFYRNHKKILKRRIERIL